MRHVNYSSLVKPDTFIGQYMSYMAGLETPTAYDFWTAVWLTSLALGRGTTVLRPRIPVHMNWYIILCAESGLTRKSTAVNKATNIARTFIGESDDILLIEDKAVPEAFEATLHVRSHVQGRAYVAISIPELVRFLGRERYNMSMPGLLTDLYDCPDQRTSPGTLTRGPSVIRNVYVSFLSASTPTWLIKSVNPNVVEGGFTSRVIFVHAERRKRKVAWPDAGRDFSGELDKSLDEMRYNAELVTDRYGGIALTDPALAWYKRWYNSRPEHRDVFRATFEAREDEHVLRLAGVLAANDDGWMVEKRHLQAATRVVAEVKERGARIFEGIGKVDSLIRAIEHMRTALLRAGTDPLSQTELYFKVRSQFDKEEFRLTLAILHELKMVQRFESAGKGKGPKTTLWRGTNLLTQQGSLELILERVET